ncbi:MULTISPECIES: hypothetical protein [unclassified Cytobacillus]|uniref:hypothetical protein n=1 Tax=unclassified Cytobacillus TaxID=2675268 RepID=UPI00135BA846|nr:hypothetical protein [Cytobacillus sp. AMY 15.2]MCM3092275.1 hypothetical protein [Cytobacillus sp. AMY 15.2]
MDQPTKKNDSLENSDNLEKLAGELLKYGQNLDFNSLLSLAGKIINDDSILNLSEGIKVSEEKAAVDETGENGDTEYLKKQMASLRAEMAALKKEVSELKRQNESLIGIYTRLVKAANQDFQKGMGLITGLSKLLK